MKNQIFGQKVDSGGDMACLVKGDGISSSDKSVDPGITDKFVVTNMRRAVELLREKGMRDYILSEDDPTLYEFASDADFAYPAVVDQENVELRVYLSTGDRRAIQASTRWEKTMAYEYPVQPVTIED